MLWFRRRELPAGEIPIIPDMAMPGIAPGPPDTGSGSDREIPGNGKTATGPGDPGILSEPAKTERVNGTGMAQRSGAAGKTAETDSIRKETDEIQ